MPKSNYLNNVVLNAALRGVAWVPPTQVYVALFTTAPTAGGGGVEVTGGGYVRQAVTFSSPVSQTTMNSGAVTFPIASAGWGTIVGFAIFDLPTAGNMLYFGSLSSPRTIVTNDQVSFPSGQLTASEA